MKKILEEIFGNEFKSYQKTDVKLPLYLKDDRFFFNVEIYDQRFVLVILPTNIRFNVISLKKQHGTYLSKFQIPVAYGFERITTFQRKSMIEKQLPFVAGNGQVFLPFIGTYFNKCETGQINDDRIHFTPASQMLFLLLIYGKDDLWVNKGQAAKVLGITPMSVSRAAKELKQLGIIEEKNVGTGIRMHRILRRMNAYEVAADYLLNPIQRIMYISDANPAGLKITAGEYALSYRSALGYPNHIEYAVNKKNESLDEWKKCDPDLVAEDQVVKVQIWKYAPELFALKGTVDPVSLLCSFKGNRDERIHKCLENIKQEIETWQIEI